MRARGLLGLAAGLAVAFGLALPARAGAIPPPPSQSQCDSLRAQRSLEPIEAYDPRPGAVRVFAMQFMQDIRNVATYAAYRAKIECLIRDWVVPRMAPGRPNVVAFNEVAGVMTVATGSRGAVARDAFGGPGAPGCEREGVPCGALAGIGSLMAAYAPQLAAYQARFPAMTGLSQVFVATTDTLVRSFMATFSDMAKRYGIWILASDFQAPFRQSSDPGDIATFADPDYPPPPSVYVATSPHVYNQVFLWGPHDVRSAGPDVLRNVVATNQKVPLTSFEATLGLTPGPSSGPAAIDNLRPYALPGSGARIGFATSLPAFVYGNPPAGVDPCSDTSAYYMRCLDELGANVVVQDEANDGRWAADNGQGIWQPLDWMGSAWRAVSDPSVHFGYAVNPMLVGNLADIPFDGQSAITQRGLAGPGCHYIGDSAPLPGDQASLSLGLPAATAYGDKPQFLALAPWIVPDGPRDQLETTAAQLAPGSGAAIEDDYLETALVADLPFPPDPGRPGCASRPSPPAQPGRQTRLASCTSARTVRIALPRRRGRALRVTVYVDGRRRSVLRHAGDSVRVSLSGARSRTVHVRLRVLTRGGRRYTLTRTYHVCGR